jgi:peptidoglycan hydrolase-like protein with peptidoglycan-binding domain
MKRTPLFIAIATALSFSAYAADEAKKESQGSASQPQAQSSTPAQSGQQSPQAASAGGTSAKKSSGQNAETVKQVQEKLAAEGHDVGQPDGKFGPKTQAALKKYQESKGIPASGQLDEKTLSELGVSADKSASSGSSAPKSESKSDSGSAAAGGTAPAGQSSEKSEKKY